MKSYLISKFLFLNRISAGIKTCSISQIPGDYFKAYRALYVPNRFDYNEELRIFFTKMRTSGIFFYINKKYSESHWKKIESFDDTITEINILHTQVIFGFFLAGLMLSVLIGILEKLKFKKL